MHVGWYALLRATVQVNVSLPSVFPLPSLLSHDHIEIMSSQGELLFFRQRDGPYIPTLRLLHKCGYFLVHG